LSADDVKWYGKVEYHRGYKWTGLEVKHGLNQRGEAKAGHQMHVQIIVSRKDSHNQRLLSLMTNHRGQVKSEAHGQKFGQFNRVDFKERSEATFDTQMGYRRSLEESFQYQNTMSNGTAQERAAMLLVQRDQEHQAEQQRVQEIQRQAGLLRQQQEQGQKLKEVQEKQQTIRQEPKKSQDLRL
jgi:hypothetical protein